MMRIKVFILTCIISFSSFAMAEKSLNYNYEMTVQPGTESIRPIAFFDNGVATFIKVKPESERVIVEGNEFQSPPNLMVFYIDKNGSEVPAPGWEWNQETNILAFPFTAKEWRIRAKGKVVGIRRSK